MSKRRKNKKKKGFTLLELVAVILVLGIIASIVVGRIIVKMDEVRKSAYKTSVANIIKSAENYAAQNLFKDPQPDYPIVFTCDSHECTNGTDKLSFKGDIPVSGTLSIDRDHRVTVSYLSNGKYCASGVKTDLQIGNGCADIDITKPELSATLEGKVIHLTFSDNIGVTAYCVTTADNSNACTWETVSGTAKDHTLQEQGTYYVFVRDAKENVSDHVEIEAPRTAFCAFEVGQTWEFTYRGSVEEWEIPCSGLYQLEVWGARGGSCDANAVIGGSAGAKASGYKALNAEDILYIAIGGAGGNSSGGWNSAGTTGAGGFNGGGKGVVHYNNNYDRGCGGGGGGATHISFENAIVKDTQNLTNILIVAGGGAGGGNSYYGSSNTNHAASSSASSNSVIGSGTNGASDTGAGGGGYYGGKRSYAGTNYIDGVPEITYKGTTYSPSTSQGANSGNGKAKITLIAN